jgi:hypothetical protein
MGTVTKPGGTALLRSSRVSFSVDNAVIQWEEGYRNLQATRSDAATFRALGRAVVAVEDALRKRLGSSFSVAELASLYRRDNDWALDLAMSAGPDRVPLIDSSTAVDAAFYLYMREAADFAGGSRIPTQPRGGP